MRLRVVLLLTTIASSVFAEDPAADAAITRGAEFLVKDALKWKEEHGCISCHHAGMIVWALREAKQHGHAVNESVLAELTKWIAESGDGKTGVPRPEGRPKALNTKPIWLGLALEADKMPDEASQQGLKLLLTTLKADQIENGSWVAWPETRPPFFGGSDESMTALALLTLHPAAAAGDPEAVAARDAGVKWLAATKSDDDPQSVAMRLLLAAKLGRPVVEMEPLAARIRERQNADGGWSQAVDMASDAWATGQALYALTHAGAKPADENISRGRAFLLKAQREDGSWPMTSRPMKPGDTGAKSLIPITGAGSAWGVIGLVRSS